jgi:hemerythrin-like metal-binding protein
MMWKDEYALGIQEIDKQHETLLGFITEFEKAVEGRAHWNTVQPLVARAREFLKFHFAVEEALMQIVAYPRFVAHRAEHQFITEQFAMLEQRVLRQEMNAQLLPSAHSWLFRHSIDSDHPFAGYAIAKRGALGRIDAE